MANLVNDLDEGVDLTFDSIYWMNENFEEQSYLIREDAFNTAQIMYLSVLSAVEKVYGKLSSLRAKNLLTSAIANRMEEVGNWMIDGEKNYEEVGNKDFLNYLGLTIEEVVGVGQMDEYAILSDWLDEYSEESNLETILTKICNLFGRVEQRDFELAFAELSGPAKQRITYLVEERIRTGEESWSNIIWRGSLKRNMRIRELKENQAIYQ
jgi:hypothetical protein